MKILIAFLGGFIFPFLFCYFGIDPAAPYYWVISILGGLAWGLLILSF